MKARPGAFVVHVPYRGASQIVPDVISGQVPIGVVSAAAGLAQAKSGKLRAIALMNTDKLAGAENVPAMADALPGFDVAPRLMLLAPAGTPADIVEKLNAAVRKVLASAELAHAAALQGAIPAYMEPAALGREMKRESAEWSKVITAQKISAQ
jgi:tripartite-type tricarboxylate transporter receptor subunit TctC